MVRPEPERAENAPRGAPLDDVLDELDRMGRHDLVDLAYWFIDLIVDRDRRLYEVEARLDAIHGATRRVAGNELVSPAMEDPEAESEGTRHAR